MHGDNLITDRFLQLFLTKRCVINNLLTHDKESYEIPKDLNPYNEFRMEHRPHDITRMGIKILKTQL